MTLAELKLCPNCVIAETRTHCLVDPCPKHRDGHAGLLRFTLSGDRYPDQGVAPHPVRDTSDPHLSPEEK